MTWRWSGVCFHRRRHVTGRTLSAGLRGDSSRVEEPEECNPSALWEEYKQANPLGYAYSWYCELYREWQRQLDVVLRQEHRAGEKTFVDYAGQTVPVTDPKSGEVRDE
jgi:transposase